MPDQIVLKRSLIYFEINCENNGKFQQVTVSTRSENWEKLARVSSSNFFCVAPNL